MIPFLRKLKEAWYFVKALAVRLFTRKDKNFPWAEFTNFLIKIINRGFGVEREERIERIRVCRESIKGFKQRDDFNPQTKMHLNKLDESSSELSQFYLDVGSAVKDYKKKLPVRKANEFQRGVLHYRRTDIELLENELENGRCVTHFDDNGLIYLCRVVRDQKASFFRGRKGLINDLSKILKKENELIGYANRSTLVDEEIEDKLIEAESENKTLSERCDEMENEIKKINEDSAKKEGDLNNKLIYLNNKIIEKNDELVKEKENHNDSLRRCEKIITELRDENNSLKQDVRGLKSDIAKMNRDRSSDNAALEKRLEERFNQQNEERNRAMKETLASFKNQLEANARIAAQPRQNYSTDDGKNNSFWPKGK